MLTGTVAWSMKEVLAVHVLRLAVGLFLVQVVYPSLFNATQTIIEVTDRLVIVLLVWLVLRRHGEEFGVYGARKELVRNAMLGLLAGVVLLGVSIFSERVYSTVMHIVPSQHPLVVWVKNASTLSDLAVPLFLAGVAAPIAEEVLYRLFTFPVLKERFGLWGGAVGSAAIFALFHFNAYWLAEIIVVGTCLALLYYWTGSLVSAIIAHSVINSAKIMLIYLGVTLI
ncbi:MAG: Abortive infection protein [Firmicutes bacterium]|nr:Abortive infection protein [Bacillota bacterium]